MMQQIEQEVTFGRIAELIEVNPKLIENIVRNSNEKKLMYHGIKRAEYARKVPTSGILPLTPEAGPCSFWSTGIRLFEPTIDSPFFNYSGGYANPNTCELNLAIASYSSLKIKNLISQPYKQDSQIIIKETVPFEEIVLLRAEIEHPTNNEANELRKYRKMAEQLLLKEICFKLNEGFEPGIVISICKKYQEAKWQK